MIAKKYPFKDENLFFKFLFDKLNVKKNSALDIGCGYGFFTYLLEKMGFRVSGLDFNFKMIQEASELYNCNYLIADSKKPPFAPKTFDLIFSKDISTFYQDIPIDSFEQRDIILEMLEIGGVHIFVSSSNLTGKKTTIPNYSVDKVSAFFTKPETEVNTYFFFAKNHWFKFLGSKGFNSIFTKLSIILTKITKHPGYIVCTVKKIK